MGLFTNIKLFFYNEKEIKLLKKNIKKNFNREDYSSKLPNHLINDKKLLELTYISNLMERDKSRKVKHWDDYDGDDESGKPIMREWTTCPICGEKVHHWMKFCYKCGQKLIF